MTKGREKFSCHKFIIFQHRFCIIFLMDENARAYTHATHVHEFVQFAIHNLPMNNTKYGAIVTNIVL